MAKQRVRNEAAPEEVAKVCRAELVNGLEKNKYMSTDSAIIAENYLAFILALLDLTLRPTAKLLAQAVKLAFKPEQGEAENFGYAIHGCVKFARNKVKSLASGAKLPSAIKAIAVKLKAKRAAPSRLNQSLRKRALQRHVSAETAASTVSSAPTVIKDFFGGQDEPAESSAACGSKDKPMPHWMAMLEKTPEGKKATPKLPVADSLVEIVSSQEVESQGVAEAQGPEAATARRKLVWFDASELVIKRLSASTGTEEKAAMAAGPRGFLMATFLGEEPMETECPNLLLEKKTTVASVKKRPAHKKTKATESKKAPATNCEEQAEETQLYEEAEAAAEEAAEEEHAAAEQGQHTEPKPDARRYLKMRYKANEKRKHVSYAIRRKFGDKKQICNFSCRQKSEKEVQAISDQVLQNLHGGMPEEQALAWGKAQLDA